MLKYLYQYLVKGDMSDEPKPTVDKPENSVDLEKIPAPESPHPVDPIDPIATTKDHSDRPWLIQQEKSKKRPIFLFGIIVAGLLALGLVSWTVYAFWYQNPEKMLGDALLNAMRSQSIDETGLLTIKNKSFNIGVNLDGTYSLKDGSSFASDLNFKTPDDSTALRMSLHGIFAPSGDLYAKVGNYKQTMDAVLRFVIESNVGKENVDKIPQALMTQIKTSYEARLNPVAEKIDGKWIKFSPDDLDKYFKSSSKKMTCIQNVVRDMPSDNQSLSELANVYLKNRLLRVKQNLGTKGDSVGYVVDIDMDTAKRFGEEVKSTKLYDNLQACSKDDASAKDDAPKDSTETSPPTYSFEVWVDQWSHQFTAIKGNITTPINGDKTLVNFDLKPKFNQPVRIDAPSNAVSFKDLTNDLTKVLLDTKDTPVPDFSALAKIKQT